MDEHLSKSNSLFKNKKVFKKDFFPKSECFHSRKIISLLDHPTENKNIKSLERHVERCGDCQKQYITAQHYFRLVDQAVPAFRPTEEIIESLHAEMRDIISRIDFESLEHTFIQKKNFGRKIESVTEGFLDVAISWKMVPVYLGAGALFMLLTQI